jgi:integrase/recombinase XerD
MKSKRTPAGKNAKEIAKLLRSERPDYSYLKRVFQCLRKELDVPVARLPKKLPDVPTEQEIESYYKAVWKSRRFQDMVIVKTFLYTGIRVSELVRVKLTDVDYERCQIRINAVKRGKDRFVPFPVSFKEVLAMHADRMKHSDAAYLLESAWKRPYSG